MGWERPNVFAPTAGAALDYAWAKPSWLPWSVAEQQACRSAVAVFDQTSFSKYVVDGPDALAALQWVCAADVDVEVGRSVYTPFLNERGTYEADVTVTRTAEDAFLVLSSSATTVRDLDWIRRHTPVDAVDVTGDYAVLGVMGPSARDLLGRLADDDLSEEAFPFATSREIDLGPAQVRATRMTYVGELGWELLVPVGDAARVYDALMSSGADLGVTNAGYYTIESMRLEKGYRAFGRELTPDFGPVEAGLRLRHGPQGGQGLPRPRRPGGAPRGACGGWPAATAGVLRARGSRADAVGRRAAAPRRRAGRSGDQRRLGGHRRCCGGTRLPAVGRPGHAGVARRVAVRGRRRGPAALPPG